MWMEEFRHTSVSSPNFRRYILVRATGSKPVYLRIPLSTYSYTPNEGDTKILPQNLLAENTLGVIREKELPT